MRVFVLTPQFLRARRVHAPHGSPDDAHVRRALNDLADDGAPTPGPDDEEALRTPFGTVWARKVPSTNLVITFVITPQTLEVTSVHPAWSAHTR